MVSYSVDAKSMMVIQFAIVGLVVTEWAAKARENTINTGVLSAAATDLFYAYDVYDFFQKQLREDTVRMIHNIKWVDLPKDVLTSSCEWHDFR